MDENVSSPVSTEASQLKVEQVPSGVDEVTGSVRSFEKQLFRSLAQEYPGVDTCVGSYWQICGLASIVLSRILSHRLGVPIGGNREGIHIEIDTGIYDPVDQPDHEAKIEPHTYTLFF